MARDKQPDDLLKDLLNKDRAPYTFAAAATSVLVMGCTGSGKQTNAREVPASGGLFIEAKPPALKLSRRRR